MGEKLCLKQSLLPFLLQPFGDLLGDQGGVAAGAVVDDEIHLGLVLYGLVHDFCRVLNPLRIQHAADHFVRWESVRSIPIRSQPAGFPH